MKIERVKHGVVDGIMAQEIAKKKLWSCGYKVKDVSFTRRNLGFDFLVNNEIRVEIKASSVRKYGGWQISQVFPQSFDILMLFVEIKELNEFRLFYSKGKEFLGKKINETTMITSFYITKENLKANFTKSPKEAFGK